MTTPVQLSPRARVESLLDAGITAQQELLARVIDREIGAGVLGLRLRQLIDEARRLESEGTRLEVTNPVLRAVFADSLVSLGGIGQLARTLSSEMVSQGTVASLQAAGSFSFIGLTADQLDVPPEDALNDAVLLAVGGALATAVNQFGESVLTELRENIVAKIAAGIGAVALAGYIVDYLRTRPLAILTTLLRTLQVEAYRRGTDLIGATNADRVGYKLWVAQLDERTCLSCISLHGTRLGINDSVDDHHNGRCIAVFVADGAQGPRWTTTRNGQAFTFDTGREWFDSLPPDQQRAIAGQANFNALQAGAVRLEDFQHRYTDEVFGEMIREASLKQLLGEAARQYYGR